MFQDEYQINDLRPHNVRTIVDIGAHVGFYTYYLAKRLPDSIPIFYFEPDPALYDLIDKNIRRNKLVNVIGFREAVGARTAQSVFYQNLTDSFSGSLEANFVATHTTSRIDVQVRSFDDFAAQIGSENLCVKVDIEGAEQMFVSGAIQEWWRISDLVIEVLGPAIAAGFVPNLMKSTGMNAYYIDDYTLHSSNEGEFTYHEPHYNWLFTRRSDSELKDALAGTRLNVHSRAGR